MNKRKRNVAKMSGVMIDPVTGLAYEDLTNILSLKADYCMVMGERSNGKTYAGLKHAIEKHIKSGYTEQTAYLRRWDTDLKGVNRKTLCDGLVENGEIRKLTSFLWETVVYRNGAYYLAKYDEELDGMVLEDEPFMYPFALNMNVHYKSTSHPKITTIIYDEFLTTKGYLVDEFVEFMNFVSTIVRKRDNVEILMLANTVQRSSLYFREMGLTKLIKEMEQGTIELYESKQGTRVAVELCTDTSTVAKVKNPSSKYFGFDNSKLSMITGGKWEMAMFPHKPFKFLPKDVRYTFYVYWEDELIRGEVVQAKDPETAITCSFLYFSPNEDNDISKLDKKTLIYSPIHSPLPNLRRKITRPTNKLEDTIASFFRSEKVFYEDNLTGDNILNYVQWCGNSKFI